MPCSTNAKEQCRVIRRFQRSMIRSGMPCSVDQAAVLFIKSGLSARWRNFFNKQNKAN